MAVSKECFIDILRSQTNYTVFNQILSVDQALQSDDLRHKVPLQRPEFAYNHSLQPQPLPALSNHNNPCQFEPDEIKMESPVMVRHQLNPVAMPGSLVSPRLSQSLMMPVSMPSNLPVSGFDHAPEVPVRSPHKSSLLQANIPSVPSRQPRPMSDMSIMSDFTQCDDTASITTRQSVNEILSLADVPMCNEINLDNLDLDFYFHDQTLIKQEVQPCTSSTSTIKKEPSRKPSVDYMGSMSSVATVREIKSGSSVQPAEEPSSSTNIAQDDLEINQIYDDVMQCVYDDVDTKYDDVVMLDDSNEPPVPPMRKRGLSVDRGVQGVDKPLPTAPKNPSIITKISEKKNELLKEREKEQEKKKQIEEQRRKEKEILEEQKRKERDEKEKKRLEEKEKKRIEEEERKQRKKKEEEEKKSSKTIDSEADKVNQSLFQRLFQRNQGSNLE